MSSNTVKDAFVWIWLPGETEPVVAGKLEDDDGFISFNYGKSYLERVGKNPPAIAIYHLYRKGGLRKLMVSALTLFGLNEMNARYASHEAYIQHPF